MDFEKEITELKQRVDELYRRSDGNRSGNLAGSTSGQGAESRPTIKEAKCGRCKGRGTIPYNAYPADISGCDVSEPCPQCNGTGIKEATKCGICGYDCGGTHGETIKEAPDVLDWLTECKGCGKSKASCECKKEPSTDIKGAPSLCSSCMITDDCDIYEPMAICTQCQKYKPSPTEDELTLEDTKALLDDLKETKSTHLLITCSECDHKFLVKPNPKTWGLKSDLINEFIKDLDPECDHTLIEKWRKRLNE
jgi:DNA-directed RNA polymerase subunit RPC12/RpoP